jgi:hypothetical protein
VYLNVLLPPNPKDQPVSLNVTISPADVPRLLELDFYFLSAAAPEPDKHKTVLCLADRACSQAESTWYPPGRYTALVRVYNGSGSGGERRLLGEATQQVFIKAAIAEATLDAKAYVATNNSFQLLAHVQPPLNDTGEVLYTFHFSDGFSTTTNEPSVSHAYNNRGAYNVSVEADNVMSQKVATRLVTVVDPLRNLSISLGPPPSSSSSFAATGAGRGAGGGDEPTRPPAPLGPTLPQVKVGDTVTFTCYGVRGDFHLYWIFEADSAPVLTTTPSVTHVFAGTGTVNVTVQATNPVSQAAAVLAVQVVLPPAKRVRATAVAVPICLTLVAVVGLVLVVRYRRVVFHRMGLEVADHDFGLAPSPDRRAVSKRTLLPGSARKKRSLFGSSDRNYGTVEMFDL